MFSTNIAPPLLSWPRMMSLACAVLVTLGSGTNYVRHFMLALQNSRGLFARLRKRYIQVSLHQTNVCAFTEVLECVPKWHGSVDGKMTASQLEPTTLQSTLPSVRGGALTTNKLMPLSLALD